MRNKQSINSASFITLTISLALLTIFDGLTPIHAKDARAQTPKILVLMSYHQGYTWEDRILEGIKQWIADSSSLPTFYVEWMDTKRYPDEIQRENFSHYLNAKYRDHHFDIILTVDDNALDLALRGGPLFEHKPIVFSGVNGDPVAMVGNRVGVTGVAERFDLVHTLEVALRLHPKSSRLLFITSDNETGAGTRDHIEQALQDSDIKLPVEHWTVAFLDQLDARLPLLHPKTLLFVLGAMPETEGGRLLGCEELVAYVRARSSLPIYTDLDNAVGYGTVGGYMNSGFKTGQVVAKLAARILADVPANSIPYVYDPPLSLLFDYQELKRLKIPLSALPEGAQLVNKPPSIFDPEFRNLLLVITAIVALLLFALAALIIRNRVQASQKATLHYQATHDKLTNLPNRTWLIDHLIFLEQTHAEPDGQIALVMMDLNRFKLVNDTYGHAFGDDVIAAVASRLKQWTKAEEELVRISGDAFAILIPYRCETELADLGDRCKKVLLEPFLIRNMRIPISASFGLSTATPGAFESDHLLREADTAMNEAKRTTRQDVYRFDDAIHQRSIRQFQIEASLPIAIENGEIFVHFQPIVDSTTNRITGYEALARWNHPELGAIPPHEFIRIATESGRISQLNQYILRQACRGYRPQLKAANRPYLSVNVSVIDIYTDAFPDCFIDILADEGIPPDRLVFEVTEDIFMGEVNIVKQALTRLHEQGIRIAIDDFGSGYASMSYLSNYMVNIIKVDRSFVRNILANESDQKIIRAIVSMAADLELLVITEGAETQAQLSLLQSLGCRLFQGYAYGGPKPPSEYPPGLAIYPIENPVNHLATSAETTS